MSDYIRIVGDTAHPLVAQLSDSSGPLDLEAGTVVNLWSRKLGDSVPTTEGLASVLNPGVPPGHPQRGMVSYNPIDADVATAGIYFVKWRVQFVGNPPTIIQSFPEGPSEILVLLPNT